MKSGTLRKTIGTALMACGMMFAHPLGEMKKHQQMTDELLGTMLEQREKMHAQMKARHEQMQSQMGKPQQTEKQAPEGHEAPHEGK